MARKKVKLMWIVNDAARKASLKKRRDGLLKKVSELTILCGIEAFVIIYCPDDPEPAIWPSRPDQIPPLQDANSLPQGPFPDDDGDGDGTGGQVRGEPGDGDGRNNPTDGGVPWDQWLADIVNNTDHNIVARGSNIFGLRLSRSRITGDISGGNSFDLRLLPHDNDILRGRISSGGNNFRCGAFPVGITMLGCKNAGNSFDPSLSRGLGFNRGGKTSAGNNFDPAGLAQGSDTRSGSAGGNNFDVLWLPHHVKNIGGNSAAVNNVDPWPAASTEDNGGESLGLGLLPGSNFSGSGAGGNPFHGMHRRGDSESGDI
ncbi:hypothetical protein OIU85_000547 [Salix viminalis]|uniref:MADS-box domain-containing protein n=1 Tax=Salix viminalis TaxID=40686 RepID=A0A9Q0VKJ0_SALVM|nr:hypothetical protein OIU85_000547 [Salix viminalis]